MKPNNGKIIGVLVLATLLLGVATLGSVQVAHLAHADTNLVFKVDATTAAGGVYARFGPHTSNTTRTNGYGVNPNQFVKLLCGVTDGEPVGPYQNKSWHFVSDLSNSDEGNFWLNDHYIDSPNVANQLVPGESTCPNESSNPMQQNDGSSHAGHLPCTPLLVIGARGSGDPYQKDANGLWGLDGTLSPLVQGLIDYYGKDNVTAYGLPYPADPVDLHHFDNLRFRSEGYGL